MSLIQFLREIILTLGGKVPQTPQIIWYIRARTFHNSIFTFFTSIFNFLSAREKKQYNNHNVMASQEWMQRAEKLSQRFSCCLVESTLKFFFDFFLSRKTVRNERKKGNERGKFGEKKSLRNICFVLVVFITKGKLFRKLFVRENFERENSLGAFHSGKSGWWKLSIIRDLRFNSLNQMGFSYFHTRSSYQNRVKFCTQNKKKGNWNFACNFLH